VTQFLQSSTIFAAQEKRRPFSRKRFKSTIKLSCLLMTSVLGNELCYVVGSLVYM
jgi:hypothetical protein